MRFTSRYIPCLCLLYERLSTTPPRPLPSARSPHMPAKTSERSQHALVAFTLTVARSFSPPSPSASALLSEARDEEVEGKDNAKVSSKAKRRKRKTNLHRSSRQTRQTPVKSCPMFNLVSPLNRHRKLHAKEGKGETWHVRPALTREENHATSSLPSQQRKGTE